MRTLAGQSTRRSHSHKRACNKYADGDAQVASFNFVHGTAFKPLSAREQTSPVGRSDAIFVCDEDNNRIRKIELRSGVTTTIAGDGHAGVRDGLGRHAKFNFPGGIGLDESGNIYVGDYAGQRIRLVAKPSTRPSASQGGS